MSKLTFKTFLTLIGVSVSLHTFASSELAQDTSVAQATQNRVELINRYPLATITERDYTILLDTIIRDIGSNKKKKVKIIWHTSPAKTKAEALHTDLVKAGISKNAIQIVGGKYKNTTYPLYVEVSQYAVKKATCRVRYGESVFWNPNETSCALKSNERIQLKY